MKMETKEERRLTWALLVPAILLALMLLWLLIRTLAGVAGSGGRAPVSDYDVVWHTQSRNSSESMPCGGGDTGLNVWVENGELLFYAGRSNMLDENNTLLKAGRIRLSFDEPLDTAVFCQRLNLQKGRVEITAGRGRQRKQIRLWADVSSPDVFAEIRTAKACQATLAYESWRFEDRHLRKNESFQNSYKWAPPKGLVQKADSVWVDDGRRVCFRHASHYDIFDVVVAQQGLDAVKDSLDNPFPDKDGNDGVLLQGYAGGASYRFEDIQEGTYLDTPFRAWRLRSQRGRRHDFQLCLRSADPDLKSPRMSRRESEAWWKAFWQRSHIVIRPGRGDGDEAWRVGRNYQLFRYQLGCNAYGQWPTRFNGGLFTFDPVFVNDKRPFTPDFRNWGGGTFTAQNQRLVYFPMLKSGDFDMMKPQFEFYRRNLNNATQRSLHYWQHPGACFTEQIEAFGLPNPSEYGWKRPEGYDAGMEYNKWLEYEWDTALEFCHMIFLCHGYSGADISGYIPLVEGVLTFFDEHYRWLAAGRGEDPLDDEGHLKLYPGSACETYKITMNASSTVAALAVVTEELLAYEKANGLSTGRWERFKATIPPLETRWIACADSPADSVQLLAPARSWERINNTEAPQLYPVWPWRLVHLNSPYLEMARNTYWHDPDVRRFYSHEGWKQYNIFAACLGLTDEAKALTLAKFHDADTRFPTFWGPGFDWTPDHNWGGSAMIGLQEMLLQTEGRRLLLFPAWPADWDVDFRLHAPGNTVVEGRLEQGKLKRLQVTPRNRMADVVNCLETKSPLRPLLPEKTFTEQN